jgi:hypothetical protein
LRLLYDDRVWKKWAAGPRAIKPDASATTDSRTTARRP